MRGAGGSGRCWVLGRGSRRRAGAKSPWSGSTTTTREDPARWTWRHSAWSCAPDHATRGGACPGRRPALEGLTVTRKQREQRTGTAALPDLWHFAPGGTLGENQGRSLYDLAD